MHTAMSLRKIANPISDFTFLSTAKSGKSRIKNPFLDSPKGKHPYMLSNHTELRKKTFLEATYSYRRYLQILQANKDSTT